MDCTDKNHIFNDVFERTKNEINQYLKKNLNEKRLKHTYAVVEEAKKLARLYGEDEKKAEMAALCHDMHRNLPIASLNMYVKHWELPKELMDNSNLSHSKITARIIERDFGIDDEDIINAVSYHTTGRANMSLLEKIIFIADAIEPGRSYPEVDRIRELAYRNIDEGCICALEHTIEYINARGFYLNADTIKARDYLKENMRNDGTKRTGL